MTTNPMDAPDPTKASRCTAHNRQGTRCGRSPSPGSNVCRLHGAAAPQVQAKARQRLLQALDPAAAELVRIAREGKKEAVRVRAIEAIMDRTGLPREEKVELGLTVADEARKRLNKAFPLEEDKG